MSNTQTLDEMVTEDQRNIAVEALRSIHARINEVFKSFGLGEDSPADGSPPENLAVVKAHVAVMLFQSHNALHNIKKMDGLR